MKSSKLIHIVSCHAEGEVGDVATAGLPARPGNAMDPTDSWPGGYRI